MKNAPIKNLYEGAADTANSTIMARFPGTNNPRLLRVINAIMSRPTMREEIDCIAGASNGPDVISQLRALGLVLPCARLSIIDRDGKLSRPGIYSVTDLDRLKLDAWLDMREG